MLLQLALKEPDTFFWDPSTDTPLQEGQLHSSTPWDPLTYRTGVHFPPPLPLDKLVILNEIQLKMQLHLESREGALRTLGRVPRRKAGEIRKELSDDALADGALTLLQPRSRSRSWTSQA